MKAFINGQRRVIQKMIIHLYGSCLNVNFWLGILVTWLGGVEKGRESAELTPYSTLPSWQREHVRRRKNVLQSRIILAPWYYYVDEFHLNLGDEIFEKELTSDSDIANVMKEIGNLIKGDLHEIASSAKLMEKSYEKKKYFLSVSQERLLTGLQAIHGTPNPLS